ncbi:hypothetical protein [uncultured Pontibacter sp.]|uniref:hypothetical protein n=1 Tax=uncultured Pontibacter sp. TaxID=453356 RepID=UPI002614AA8A|nr:hypothetical protein [uncultured Pontibacter sp.]
MTEIPDQYIELIKKEFDIQNKTEALNKKLDSVVDEIHQIFQQYGISRKITKHDVMFGRTHFGNRMILNCDIVTREMIVEYAPKLSEIIFDYYYPRPQISEFYHFTKLDSAIKILTSEKFRLYNLIKNYDFDEFRTFYNDHNIDGYRKSYAPNGDLYEKHIMKQTYSLSLAKKSTLNNLQEDSMWEVFADCSKGVKLEFEVQSQHIDFRDIYYKYTSTPNHTLLLKALESHFMSKYNRQFALSKISKIGGFYLPSSYDIENETRFLIKEHTDDYDFNFTVHQEAGDVAFIELPFISKYGSFRIKAIHLGQNCDKQKAKEEFQKLKLEKILR